ncbi:methyltransferase domain-containing protein [Salinicola corii]|uniref:Methyltransferase domain-containing protein n=1 Tax=Salinicola corii TaxID=2606937 RepID=A0A640WCP4_9GAMM|nr:class I SAM-dependent methyltransferase [Salinicola corii]KAA0016916.1 methyltransferase domain-containing protein [Salinicola corii]
MSDAERHNDHSAVVERQFGAQAAAYLSSSVHAQGAEFVQLRERVGRLDAPRVLDLGCGAGHVSFQVADLAAEVVAYDLSPRMLGVVAEAGGERGFGNIRTVQGVAESLPFADHSFDVVCSRFSAHHWRDVGLALREARRVLKPGGLAAFIDVAASEQPLFDSFLQTIEMLRDTSHVRDYAPSEWARMVGEAGLVMTSSSRQRLRLDFDTWIARMRTPDVMRDAIRHLQSQVGQEVRDAFEISDDGAFSTDMLVLWATK